MVEKIVAALRKSFLVVFSRNIWLFWYALAYNLLGPLLILGFTALPVVYWIVAGHDFDLELLYSQPLEFIAGAWRLILYSLAGYTVGFIVFLALYLFFHGALTSVISRAARNYNIGANEKMPQEMFLAEGRRLFPASAGTAAVAGLLPLPGLVALMVLAAVLLLRLGDGHLGMAGLHSSLFMLLVLAGSVAMLLVTILLTVLALLWYRYSLCAAVAGNLSVGRAVRQAAGFCARAWHGVLGLALVHILLGLALTAFPMSISYGIKLISGSGFLFPFLFNLISTPLTILAGIAFELWMKSALVVFYLDNR
ncbi:MAG: hypothetical protein U9P14_08145 [Gemmatimonadota bacterium]|nr:hypothetical protein [Gemmatimonadota bacterium]